MTHDPTALEVERLDEGQLLCELGLLFNYAHDDSRQFTRWQMVTAISHGYRLALSQARDVAMEGGWQPIETAPRDGRYVLVAGGTYEHPHGMASLPYRGVSMARWDKMFSLWEGHQVAHDDYYTHEPTHWMPLPAAPLPSKLKES